jgi:hypothetical protein
MAQTPGTLSGHIMGLYIGANRIAAIKNVNLEFSASMMDANNADSGDYDVVKPSRRNWSASGNGHFQFDSAHNMQELFDAWKAGTKLVCKFTTHNADDLDYTGNGYIESLKAAFPDHEATTYDFSIKGTTDSYKTIHPLEAPNGSCHNLVLTIIDNQIGLAWVNDSNNEDAVSIERSDNGGVTWTEISESSAPVTSYTDTEVSAESTYYYRVRAEKDGYYTEYSNIAWATTPAS